MLDTITRYLNAVPDLSMRRALQLIISPIGDRMSTHSIMPAGLAIKAALSPTVKTGAAAYYGVVQGKLVTIAAATDMPALVGTVTNAKFNAFVIFIDVASVRTVAMGVEAATLAGVALPAPPVGQATVGYVIINPTGTGNFVGGTTALDDATVVPNAAYINLTGPIDASIIL